jgi:hypothetical protein
MRVFIRSLRVILRSHVGSVLGSAFFATVLSVAGCQSAGAAPQSAESTESTDSVSPAPQVTPDAPSGNSTTPFNNDRILGVIPDYQTVRDTSVPVAPLTPRQKWQLAWKETIDPFNIASVFLAAGYSQIDNQTPKYGEGGAAYGKRVGAAFGDFGSQNFFSAGLLATWWHQDPRYFRKGPQARFLTRVGYSISRLVVTPRDSGSETFNSSGIFGMVMGIAASNLYYPSASVKTSVMAERLNTSLLGGAIGNLMSEFWPDAEQKFFHKRH